MSGRVDGLRSSCRKTCFERLCPSSHFSLHMCHRAFIVPQSVCSGSMEWRRGRYGTCRLPYRVELRTVDFRGKAFSLVLTPLNDREGVGVCGFSGFVRFFLPLFTTHSVVFCRSSNFSAPLFDFVRTLAIFPTFQPTTSWCSVLNKLIWPRQISENRAIFTSM